MKFYKIITLIAKNLPRVAQIDARVAEATMIRDQKQKQDLFNRTHTKYPECRTTVFQPTDYVETLDKDHHHLLSKPATTLELEFVHGYHNTFSTFNTSTSSHENDTNGCCSTSNLYMLSSGEMVYYTSGVAVMYNQKTHTQRFFIPEDNSTPAEEVTSLTVHPNQSIVATGYAGREALIHIWDSGAQAESSSQAVGLATLTGHTQSVRCLDFSHDGKLLISLGGDVYNTIRVWKWKTSTLLTQTRGHSSMVYSVRFNPYQAMGIPDKDPQPGQALYEEQACYTIVSCGARHIRFWVLRKQAGEKKSTQVSEETAFFGSTFGSPSRPKMKMKKKQTPLMWKLEGNPPLMLDKGEMQNFTCFAFVNDSAPLYIYDSNQRKVIRTNQTNHSFGRIVAGTAKGDIYVFWQPRKCVGGTTDAEMQDRVRWWEVSDDAGDFEQFQWEPTARLLIMIPHNITTGNRFKLDPVTSTELDELNQKLKAKPNSKSLRSRRKELEYKGILGHDGAVLRMCYNPESDILLTSAVDGSLMAWQLVMDLAPTVPGVNVLGKYTSVQNSISDGQHEFNQIAGTDGEPLEFHFQNGLQVRSLSWTFDTVLLGMNNNSIYRMDMSKCISATPQLNPELVLESNTSGLINTDIHPFQQVFATLSTDNRAKIWCMKQRLCLGTLELPSRGTAVAFDPKGNHIALGTAQGEFLLVDYDHLNILVRKAVRASEKASPQKRHKNQAITDIKYSPNGLYLALGARDNCIYVLDVERGYKKLYTCYGHANFITHLDWSRDSSVFQTNSGDGEILYWEAASGKQLTDTMSVSSVETTTVVSGLLLT